MKFLVATFHGNQRMKMSQNYDQNFDAFFDRVGENFRLNFAIRDYVQKICGEVQTLVAFCAYALSHTPTDTHTHTKSAKR